MAMTMAMNKQELLTKLAIECESWQETQRPSSELRFLIEAFQISQKDWLAERKRLLNKPSWDNAPDVATHLAMDSDGCHFFYNGIPNRQYMAWHIGNGKFGWAASIAIAVPAGYDWRDSLEERDSTSASCAACGHLMLKENLNLQDDGAHTCTTAVLLGGL